MNESQRCPYCGSVETINGKCSWCHSDIRENNKNTEE